VVRAPFEIVRDHIAALARSDWTALESTVSHPVQMKLVGVDDDDWEWTLSTLYRHVSQAWDYVPEDVQLSDGDDGAVRARIRFTNGGAVKVVEGRYRISGDCIDSIILTDEPPRAAD